MKIKFILSLFFLLFFSISLPVMESDAGAEVDYRRLFSVIGGVFCFGFSYASYTYAKRKMNEISSLYDTKNNLAKIGFGTVGFTTSALGFCAAVELLSSSLVDKRPLTSSLLINR